MSDRGHVVTEVRSAQLADLMGVVATLERALLLAEHPLPQPEYPYAMHYTLDLIGRGLGWVALHAGSIVGVILLDQYTTPWNRQAPHLENVHFWVEPRHRKGGTAERLLDAAKAHAQAQGLPLRVRVTYGSSDAPLVSRWLQAQGFAYVGGNFALKAVPESH